MADQKRWLSLLFVAQFLIVGGCGKVVTTYRGTLEGQKVIVFEKHNAKSLISVHADKTKVLQVGQEQFESVRGFGCGFRHVTELHALVFVTEENGSAFIHAFNLSKNVDVKALLGDASGFGYWLGTSNRQHEVVSTTTSNALVLSLWGLSYPERKSTRWDFIFDLDRKSVRAHGRKN